MDYLGWFRDWMDWHAPEMRGTTTARREASRAGEDQLWAAGAMKYRPTDDGEARSHP